MEASLKNTFAKVRAIVDERISLRDARRKTGRSLFMKRESGESTVPGLFTSDGKEFSELCCSICMDKVQKSIRMPAPKLCFRIGRLPEGLPVPPVGPRLPNLNAANLSFAARLLIAIRDKFGGDAPRVYTAAGVTRQAYSQIVSDETRPVSKRTAVRFAFALHSTPEEARLLLRSAGYAFSNSRTEDFILQACLEVNPPIWDFVHVNELLREYRVDFQY